MKSTSCKNIYDTLVVVGVIRLNSKKILTDLASRSKVIYAVSSEYSEFDASSVPDNVHLVSDDASRVFSHRLHANAPPDHVLSPYTDGLNFLKITDSNITYMCVETALAANEFELASLVRTETFFSRKWIMAPGGVDEAITPIDLPDIFNGQKSAYAVRESLSTSQKSALRFLIIEGIDILRCYLRAGYHEMRNDVGVPGWAIQTGGVWNTFIISFFHIIPGANDQFHQDNIFESSSFRKLMCDATLRVLSNYFFCMFGGGGDGGTRVMVSAADLIEALATASDDGDDGDEYGDSSKEDINAIAWSKVSLWDKIRQRYVDARDLV